MRLLKWLLLGLAALLCSGVILFICAIIFVGNDTKVSFGKELRSWHIATIVAVAKLPAEETIDMFYSSNLFQPDTDGNLLTNAGLYSWSDVIYGETMTMKRFRLEEIAQVTTQQATSWLDDTIVTVFNSQGDFIILTLPMDEGRDRIFVEKLRAHIPVKPVVPVEGEDEPEEE